jgi:hypothetical protein
MTMVTMTTTVLSTIRVTITGIEDIPMPGMHTAAVMAIIPHPTATAGCSLQPSS